MLNDIMLLKLLVLLCMMSLLHAVERVEKFEENITGERNVYLGFPLGVVCADVSTFPSSDYSKDFPIGEDQMTLDGVDMFSGNAEDYEDLEAVNPDMPTSNEEVQCTIRRGDAVVYNESIIWRDNFMRGVFDYADEKWDDVEIIISVSWGDDHHNDRSFTTKLKSVAKHECSNVEPVATVKRTEDADYDEIKLECNFDATLQEPERLYMSEEHYNSLSVAWWRGCEKITQHDSNYEINLKTYSQNGVEFPSLTIKKASLLTTPGEYHCTLERDAPTGKIEIVPKSYTICLQKPYQVSTVPTITLSMVEMSVAPGLDLDLVAFGNSGQLPDSLTLSVYWYKWHQQDGEWKEECSAHNTDGHCTLLKNRNKVYCEPIRSSELKDIANRKNDDNFTSTYTLRSVTQEDTGLYKVSLLTSKYTEPKNFTVKLQHPPNHQKLVIGFCVFGVLVLIALVLLLLMHIYSIEIRYLKKKIFAPEIFDSMPMAYLLYSPDASNDGDPVQVVRNFIAGRRYYDANNMNGAPERNPAGKLFGDHLIDMLRECMSLVIFVTPDMLNENEVEILAAYKGFDDNIQTDLPIIFITTPKTRSMIKGTSSGDNRTIATFRESMKRERNKEIQWDERHPKRFRRALYAFLPKVASPGVRHQEAKV